jgi:hypothetical protein
MVNGRPRFTNALDIFVGPTEANGARLVQALEDFGFGSVRLRIDDFSRAGRIVQLGVAGNQIALQTVIDGVTFA